MECFLQNFIFGACYNAYESREYQVLREANYDIRVGKILRQIQSFVTQL